MLRLFLCVIIAMSIVPKPSKAKEASYFDMQLPVMTGAENISHSRDDQYYSTSLSYDIVIDSPDPVYDFYDAFFKKQGWKGFMEGHSMSGKWNGYSANISSEGGAVFAHSSRWQPSDVPVFGSVNLMINDYKDGKFYAEIQVTLTPELNDSPFFEFSKLLSDPKNIFILEKAVGRDPFQFEDVNLDLIPKGYADELVIKEYKNLIEGTLQLYKDFGEQYVHRSKPIDGKFKKRFSARAESALSNDIDADQDAEQEDPLSRWRALQEEREKEQSQSCDCTK